MPVALKYKLRFGFLLSKSGGAIQENQVTFSIFTFPTLSQNWLLHMAHLNSGSESLKRYCLLCTTTSSLRALLPFVPYRSPVLVYQLLNKFNQYDAKVVADHKSKDKRIKGEVEGESEVKTKCSTQVSRNSSKENSKACEVQKPDYIHVRARRGQATDSHSLAERARREKISKKMKCLQDLVPGCNKVTGKAGMLDEIINYVQSLQRQVEFLSMKIAALNSSVEFNVENLPIKEFPAYVANFPAAAKLPAMPNLTCFQLNPMQKEAVNCMLNETIHPPLTATEGIASASVSIPEQALSSSTITWEASKYHPHLQIELPSTDLEKITRNPLEGASVFCYKLTFSHGVYVTGSHRPQALRGKQKNPILLLPVCSPWKAVPYNGMDVTVLDRQQATYPLELFASSVPLFQSYLVGGGPEFGDSEKLNLVPPDAAPGYCISRTSSCQMTAFHAASMKEEREDMILEKMESTTGSGSRESFTKRKAEQLQPFSTWNMDPQGLYNVYDMGFH
ncbi:hypothetical protein GOBAR_DD00787 [Gossypium barbadense]|nr:hypothetical protein GOBAR_DD00787 [Gossypium barbadense]